MDGRLAIPKALVTPIMNRLHYYYHGRDKMCAASKDIWIPMLHRNLAATAMLCKHCLEAGKNLKLGIATGNLGETYIPTEPNEVVQLDFRGPVNYEKRRKKHAFIAVDVCPHWPLASVCSSNNSRIVLKFLRKYIATHRHSLKPQMDQASWFFSKKSEISAESKTSNC